MKFQVEKRGLDWRWFAIARNGKVIARSEFALGFATKRAAIESIKSFIRNVNGSGTFDCVVFNGGDGSNTQIVVGAQA